MDAVVVIRAGGFGTRLWPKSRRSLPKQFLVLYGEKTLLQHSYERALTLVPLDRIYVSVQEQHVGLVLQQLPVDRDHLIVEPCAKNTGPAICLETVFLYKKLGNVTVLTMPCDDYIGNGEAFREFFITAVQGVQKHACPFTAAVPPKEVDTGFSYMSGEKKEEGMYEVTTWVEKPDTKTCAKLLAQGNYFVHIGLYVWSVKYLYNLIYREVPGYAKAVSDWLERKDARAYESLEKVSVEKLLVRKSGTIYFVVSQDLDWQDVGTWSRLIKILPQDSQGNVVVGRAVPQNAPGLFLHGKNQKVVVVSGLPDLAVIDTDDVLYICPRSALDDVSKTVEFLEKEHTSVL